MRRWLAWSAKLYPRAWRQRYGVEFDALMEDVEPDWQELANVLGGAMKMQMKSDTAFLKLGAAMAVLGAVVALAVSFRLPDRYVSSAVLKMTPPGDDAAAQEHLVLTQQEILSRNSLAELIQRPSLNLYPAERRRMPLEDVIAQMRRDIQIGRAAGADGAARTFHVSFIYPDPVKAQAVTTELTTKFIETNLAVNRNREAMWRAAWHEDPPPGETLECIARPSGPTKSGGPNRLIFGTVGLFAGVLIASVLRWPRPAFRLAVFALAGCVLAGGASLLFRNRYTSTAVMRIAPALDPNRWQAGRTVESPAERLERLTHEVLNPDNLKELTLRPSLALYQGANSPVDEMVRNIRIQMRSPATLVISFSHADHLKAQAVARELVTQFIERNFIEERERTKTAGPEFQMMAAHKLGENLEILDRPNLPQGPDSPNRLAIAAAGFAAGLLLGIATLLRNQPEGPALRDPVGVPPS